MASLPYLWAKRARFPIGSKGFCRAWAKRFLCFRELCRRNRTRRKWVQRGAQIASTAEIGSAVAEGKLRRLSIGEFSFVGRAHLALHAGIVIGDRVCINDGVEMLTASHNVSDPLWRHVSADIVIDDYAWIGTNALILPGVKIGRGAVVGAGAVVSKSVAPYSIVVGNPAKPLLKTRCEDLRYNPCEFLAANRAWLVG